MKEQCADADDEGRDEEAIDLSAFPLLRLDQLPHAHTATLEQSLAKLSPVQQDDEKETPPLSFTRRYASRQVEAMAKELGRRRPVLPPPTLPRRLAAPPPPAPPPACSSPRDFVIRSTRPKASTRGGHNPRAMARARLQQYKAWRQQEEAGQKDDAKEEASSEEPSSSSSPRVPVPLPLRPPSPLLLPKSPSPPVPDEVQAKENKDDEDEDDGMVPVYAPHDEAAPAVAPAEQQQEEENTHTAPNSKQEFYFRLATSSSRPEVQSIVGDVFAHAFPEWREWRPQDEGGIIPRPGHHDSTWHLMWTWCKPRLDYTALLPHQWVNHIPHSRELTRKDLLVRHLNRYRALTDLAVRPRAASLGQQPQPHTKATSAAAAFFHVMPQTFVLPQAYTDFVVAFRTASPPGIWILKPIESSRGRGITLVDSLVQVVYSEPVVVQRYVANPLLLDSYKFDLRLYVLVTSFQPSLEAFIYTEGFVRLCTLPFQLQDLGNPLVHVTNSSVQTRQATRGGALADAHPLCTAPPVHMGGSKLRLTYLWERLRAQGAATEAVWQDIVAVVLKSLVCVADAIPPQPRAFELFGYDVLLDADLRPWLLEVNASPSLAREHPLDKEVKEAMLADTIRLVHKGEKGRYERLCPDTKAHRKVLAYKRRFVRPKN